MQATILDLRYHMKKILAALSRNEKVQIFYRGKLKGVLTPAEEQEQALTSLTKHPAFGMYQGDKKEPVDSLVRNIRKRRYHDL